MLIFVIDVQAASADPFNRYFLPGHQSPLIVGGRHLPLAEDKLRGKHVRIPKGTLIRSLHPRDPMEWFAIKRTATITVFRSSPGHVNEPYYARHQKDLGRSYSEAELTWPGTGGYWKRVKLRDVEILDQIEGIPAVTKEEIDQFDSYLATIFPIQAQVSL